MNYEEEKLSLEQQIRRISADNKTVGFRIWKSRMKAINLESNAEEYINNGYKLINEARQNANDTKTKA